MSSPEATPLVGGILSAWPLDSWRESNVVLAVSAGPDSVAMLHAMLALKHESGGRGQLFVAHLHHGLRGATADADEAWLSTLCQRLDVPLETGRADVAALATTDKGGVEAVARGARYQFLGAAAMRLGARFVAVAHTRDDQVETVLHRILRGTGLRGLAGMPLTRPLAHGIQLVRPLLTVTRSDVLAFLNEIGETYREDETNADPRWTRNRLRHSLLPLLRAHYNTGVDEALLRLSDQARDVEQFVSACSAELVERCVSVDRPLAFEGLPPATQVRIQCGPLADTPPVLVCEVCRAAWSRAGWPLQAVGFVHWQQLAKMIHCRHAAPANLPGNVLARRVDGDVLLLERR